MIVSIIQLIIISIGFYITISHFKCVRACSYIERFNSGDFVNCRITVEKWLHEYSTEDERILAIQNDPSLAVHVKTFANLFQEMGVAYRYRTVSRKIVKDNFDLLIVMYWEKLKFWIIYYRRENSPTLYGQFEMLQSKFT